MHICKYMYTYMYYCIYDVNGVVIKPNELACSAELHPV